MKPKAGEKGEKEMNDTTEHDALTNMARGLNLTIHQYQEGDRRRKTRRYFAQRGKSTMSPTLDYITLNHFLLGWRKASERVRHGGKVIIEVRGGVAEVTSRPEGIEVEVIDHDNH